MKKVKIPALTRFLANEERAGNIIVFGLAGIVGAAFLVAVGAMLLMK